MDHLFTFRAFLVFERMNFVIEHLTFFKHSVANDKKGANISCPVPIKQCVTHLSGSRGKGNSFFQLKNLNTRLKVDTPA